jgi:hypothetical protein
MVILVEQTRRRCFIGETWPIWPAVTHEQCRSNAGGGKVDLRMDSLALRNVLTWHFNLHVTKFSLGIASEQRLLSDRRPWYRVSLVYLRPLNLSEKLPEILSIYLASLKPSLGASG